ncbi:MAG: hypothetical protein ABSB49_00630 [Polyangia bacterium]
MKANAALPGLSHLPLAGVRVGMLLVQGVTSTAGLLLVARGQEVTQGLLQRLRNLPRGSVREPVALFLPSTAATEA